jgi:hypothetical protein
VTRTAGDSAIEYCRAVNAKDADGLRAIFADDAVALNTIGEFQGRDAILSFYTDVVFAHHVTVEPTHTYEAGATCVVELEGRAPGAAEVQRMVDIFTVDPDGLITRLAIYRR